MAFQVTNLTRIALITAFFTRDIMLETIFTNLYRICSQCLDTIFQNIAISLHETYNLKLKRVLRQLKIASFHGATGELYNHKFQSRKAIFYR